ncbi:MAG: UDP-glucose/GDP-mannose dehydrogenase family protein [Chitinophagaceae bacterium]|nr:UDP-glucose/GDP-mannose dehydrogenase family protein [Chitinophagaceae bacterium]
MKIVVIGTGYVGLVSGVCLSNVGHNVVCVDLNPEIIDSLNSGRPHIYENGLNNLLKSVIDSGRFQASLDLKGSMSGADGLIIAVGTPSNEGRIDLDQILKVCREIGDYLVDYEGVLPIIIKSTVIPGTTDSFIFNEIINISGTPNFSLGMNPEFLREGEAIDDFMNPDRIIFGADGKEALDFLESIYEPWNVEKIIVNTRTAEMIKYANNTVLASLISLFNEFSVLAHAAGGIDMKNIVEGVSLDKRWSPIIADVRICPGIINYMKPGPGFGGSCFPKDVSGLKYFGESFGLAMTMTRSIIEVNDRQPDFLISYLEEEVNLSEELILVLGLTFKENTDDVRESPSFKVIESLVNKGSKVFAYDPFGIENFKKRLKVSHKVTFVSDWLETLKLVSVVVVLTNWTEFHILNDIDLSDKVIFDARGVLNHNKLKTKKTITF